MEYRWVEYCWFIVPLEGVPLDGVLLVLKWSLLGDVVGCVSALKKHTLS